MWKTKKYGQHLNLRIFSGEMFFTWRVGSFEEDCRKNTYLWDRLYHGEWVVIWNILSQEDRELLERLYIYPVLCSSIL